MSEEQRFQTLLIDAICGVGFPTLLFGTECLKAGLARNVGDQWGVEFVWDRLVLGGVDIPQLQELYDGLCDLRDKNFVPTDEVEDFKPSILLGGH